MARQFQKNVISHVHIIQCPVALDEGAIQEFVQSVPQWLDQTERLHLLDWKGVTSIHSTFYPQIALFQQQLNKKGGMIVSLHLAPDLLKQIEKDGVERIFNPIHDLKQALAKLGLMNSASSKEDSSQLTVDFLKPLVVAVLATVSSIANIKVTVAGNKPVADPAQLQIDLTTMVNIENERIEGNIALYMPNEMVKGLCTKVFQSPNIDFDKEGADLNREILNIASGKAKTDWAERLGYSVKRGTITTIPKDELIKHKEGFLASAVVLGFQTDFGLFYLGIKINRKAV